MKTQIRSGSVDVPGPGVRVRRRSWFELNAHPAHSHRPTNLTLVATNQIQLKTLNLVHQHGHRLAHAIQRSLAQPSIRLREQWVNKSAPITSRLRGPELMARDNRRQPSTGQYDDVGAHPCAPYPSNRNPPGRVCMCAIVFDFGCGSWCSIGLASTHATTHVPNRAEHRAPFRARQRRGEGDGSYGNGSSGSRKA